MRLLCGFLSELLNCVLYFAVVNSFVMPYILRWI